jgi:hypothetical protein
MPTASVGMAPVCKVSQQRILYPHAPISLTGWKILGIQNFATRLFGGGEYDSIPEMELEFAS